MPSSGRLNISITRKGVWDVLLWPVIYLGCAISYIYALSLYDDVSAFEEYSIAATLPVIALILSFIAERINPYKKDWNKLDMQAINNFLYQFITTYGEALGKSLSLVAAPFILSLVNIGNTGIWPASLPVFLQVILGLLIYDFIYYWYHRISHFTHWLWRLHRLHHSTERLNVLAGFRFNIIDILIEISIIFTVITVIGIPEKIFFNMLGFMIPATVLSHANFEAKLPWFLEWMVISPSTHRIHHAKDDSLLNANFGGFTLLWDVVFGTYKSSKDHSIEKTGVSGHETSPWIWTQQVDFLKSDN